MLEILRRIQLHKGNKWTVVYEDKSYVSSSKQRALLALNSKGLLKDADYIEVTVYREVEG